MPEIGGLKGGHVSAVGTIKLRGGLMALEAAEGNGWEVTGAYGERKREALLYAHLLVVTLCQNPV